MSDRLYFRQLLSGRDFARSDFIAQQMVNFVYLIGDRDSGEALIVDPAYDVSELLDILSADGMRCVGVLATHYHADHIGGDIFGHTIAGIVALLERVDVPVHVQSAEAPWVTRSTGVGASSLVEHAGGDSVSVGAIPIQLVHTPGHTPGSQCFLLDDRLVSGDTLFLQGCGRTDLPGSDPEAMYESLTTRLARLPDQVVVYPGHHYSPAFSADMGEIRRTNYALAPRSLEQWLAMFGR